MAMCINPIYLSDECKGVPCGRCGFCLQTRKREWQFRLSVELKHSESAHFVTLTYDDDYVPVQNGQDVLCKPDLQKFFKRLRYYNSLHSPTQVRYFAVGEYGTTTRRPHYHAIIFNCRASDIEKSWPCGFIKHEKVNMASIGYVVGYTTSIDNESVSRGVPKQFAVMSRSPAIGHQYINTHGQWHSQGTFNFTKVFGVVGRLPRYYKKKFHQLKLWTDRQKELITEQCLKSFDDYYYSWRQHFSRSGCSNPDYKIKEMQLNVERQILQQVKSLTLQI